MNPEVLVGRRRFLPLLGAVALLALLWRRSEETKPALGQLTIPFSALIRDSHGGEIIVSPSPKQYSLIKKLSQTHSPRWFGGRLVSSRNSWGFNFKPLVIAEVTAEAYQTWLEDIKEHREYWFRLGQAFVQATVLGVAR